MKLIELKPRWIADEGRHGMGMYFDCPCCVGKKYIVRIGIYFNNPVDGGAPKKEDERWDRTGDDFETMTFPFLLVLI